MPFESTKKPINLYFGDRYKKEKHMKSIKITLFSAVFMLGFSFLGTAQDIHFSQFYQSPLNLNPALTGVMDCNIRFVANYRNQWAAILRENAYNTYSFSYDQKFTAFRRDYFGVGATFWGDRAGEVDFSTIQAKVSGSFAKYLGGGRRSAHYLSVGVEGGLAQRRIDFLQARYGTQNINGVFEPSIPSGETFVNDNFLFGDLSAGILWFSTFDEDKSFYLGGAYHHINRPSVSFETSETTRSVLLWSRYTIHGGGEMPIGYRTSLIPGAVLMFQGPSFQLNGGTSVRFQLGSSRYDYQAFQFGAWIRLANQFVLDIEDPTNESYTIGADAIILSTRFQYNNFDFGFSYDINVSTLNVGANGNGSFEFSVAYKICGPERRGVYCPNF